MRVFGWKAKRGEVGVRCFGGEAAEGGGVEDLFGEYNWDLGVMIR